MFTCIGTQGFSTRRHIVAHNVYYFFPHTQASAKCFGERMISDEFARLISTTEDLEMKQTLNLIYKLYLLDIVERELGWFIANGVVSPNTAKQVCRWS